MAYLSTIIRCQRDYEMYLQTHNRSRMHTYLCQLHHISLNHQHPGRDTPRYSACSMPRRATGAGSRIDDMLMCAHSAIWVDMERLSATIGQRSQSRDQRPSTRHLIQTRRLHNF